MKTLVITLLLLASLNSVSQDTDRRQRIKALKVAFLTEQLELSKTEAEKFWPIYNAFEDEEHNFRKDRFLKRKATDMELLSEQDAKKMIDEMLVLEKNKLELREKFIRDLQKILPAKKIIKLKMAEDEFNKKMFEEYKKRKDSKKNKP